MAVPLDLISIRREQRRLAALLQRDVTLPHHKLRRNPIPLDNLVFMNNKFDGVKKSKHLRGLNNDADANRVRHSHDAAFPEHSNHHGGHPRSRDGPSDLDREVSKSFDDGLYMTRLPSITITNRVTNTVLNAKDKKKKKTSELLYKNIREDSGMDEPRVSNGGNDRRYKNSYEDTKTGRRHSRVSNNDYDSVVEYNENDVMYDENGDIIGHLRYQHGVMSNLPNENMGFLVSRENTEATASSLFRIASYENGKSYCTCAKGAGRSIVRCTECENEITHEKWCPSAASAIQSRCNNCGKLIRQMTSHGSFVNSAEKSGSKRHHTTASTSQSKIGDRKKKVRVRVPGDVDSNDSGLERSDAESLFDDDPEQAEMYLRDLERKLKGGAFDFHTDVNVNNVNTKLRFADDDDLGIEKDFKGRADGDDEDEDPLEDAHVTKNGRLIYKNGVREAYTKALAATFARKAIKNPFYPHRFVSRPYAFSYFGRGQKGDSSISQVALPKAKKLAPMKIIFGKVKVDDYFPGGKMNPRKALKKKSKLKSHSAAVLPSVMEELKEKQGDIQTKSTSALPANTANNDGAL